MMLRLLGNHHHYHFSQPATAAAARNHRRLVHVIVAQQHQPSNVILLQQLQRSPSQQQQQQVSKRSCWTTNQGRGYCSTAVVTTADATESIRCRAGIFIHATEATIASSSLLSASLSLSSRGASSNGDGSSFLTAAAAAAVATSVVLFSTFLVNGHKGEVDFTATATTRARTFCQSAAETKDKDQAVDEEDDDDDEFALNDQEKEEKTTTCGVCNTFRQGPCGLYWRKVEKCFKQNENVEKGATKCMKYFTPHQTCLMEYTNLYSLISLDVTKQDLIHDAELSVASHERRSGSILGEDNIDWSAWISYTQEHGIDSNSAKDALAVTLTAPTATSSSNSSNGHTTSNVTTRNSLLSTIMGKTSSTPPPMKKNTIPLWKRIPENTEPLLVTLSATIDLMDHETNMILKIAYVLDQDGMVLGLIYNPAYGDLLKQIDEAAAAASTTESKQIKEQDDEGDKDNIPTANNSDNSNNKSNSLSLEFFVMPGETQQIQVKAMYSENPVEADPNKDILDVCLVEGPMITLADVVASQKITKQQQQQQMEEDNGKSSSSTRMTTKQ